MPHHLESGQVDSRAGVELRSFTKVFHFTDEGTDHIMRNILANFPVSYSGDLIGKKKWKARSQVFRKFKA